MQKIPNRTRTTARINIGVMARFETYRRNAFQPIVPAQSWLIERVIVEVLKQPRLLEHIVDVWLKQKGI